MNGVLFLDRISRSPNWFQTHSAAGKGLDLVIFYLHLLNPGIADVSDQCEVLTESDDMVSILTICCHLKLYLYSASNVRHPSATGTSYSVLEMFSLCAKNHRHVVWRCRLTFFSTHFRMIFLCF